MIYVSENKHWGGYGMLTDEGGYEIHEDPIINTRTF